MAKINTVQHACNEHAYNKFTNISNILLTYGIISCLFPSEVGADESKGTQLPYNVVVCLMYLLVYLMYTCFVL